MVKTKMLRHTKTKFLSLSSKKGQISQIFIYISAILVIGFIVLFGYKMIGKVLNQKCSVEEQDFMLSVNGFVDQNIRYGSRDEGVLPVACDYELLCFVDANVVGTNNWEKPIDTNSAYYDIEPAIMIANAQDNISYNVYLYKRGTEDIAYPVAFDKRIHITGEDSVLCMTPTAGSFRFMIEGLGKNGVELSVS